MSKAFFYLQNDVSATSLLALNNSRRKLIHFFCGIVMRIKLHFIGVRFGRNILWGGVAYVERFPLSQIIIGNNCRFNSNSLFNQRGSRCCILQTGTAKARIRIGDNCAFSGVSIVSDVEVDIGNDVMVGANSLIGDRDDHYERLHTVQKKVTIKDNVFIGMYCMIMKGVTIGENSIIAAGSIVTKDIPANCVAAGSPCKVIKQI